MPFYLFKCENCGREREIEQKASDKRNDKVCPKCKSKMRIQIQATSFHLVGTGWYTTDYKKGGNKSDKNS